MLLLGLSSHGWCEQGDGQVGEQQLGSHKLPSSVLSLHIFRLYEEIHLCWTHGWHDKECPSLLLVSHSLRPAGRDASLAPSLDTQGWVGCEPREWLCYEQLIMEMCAVPYRLKSPKMCSGEISWLREYIVSREDGVICICMFGQI